LPYTEQTIRLSLDCHIPIYVSDALVSRTAYPAARTDFNVLDEQPQQLRRELVNGRESLRLFNESATAFTPCAKPCGSATPGTTAPFGQRTSRGHGNCFWSKYEKIYEENPDIRNYGVERILLALAQRGVEASHSSVRRAMKKGGLLKVPSRRPQGPMNSLPALIETRFVKGCLHKIGPMTDFLQS
jgi:hypothetical protein